MLAGHCLGKVHCAQWGRLWATVGLAVAFQQCKVLVRKNGSVQLIYRQINSQYEFSSYTSYTCLISNHI